jgi:ABC-type microcin C transport system duplicated ATPase subunit YejF
VPMLLVEQDLRVVARLAHDVVVMAEGRVVHTGTAAELFADTSLVQRLLGVHSGGSPASPEAHSGGSPASPEAYLAGSPASPEAPRVSR